MTDLIDAGRSRAHLRGLDGWSNLAIASAAGLDATTIRALRLGVTRQVLVTTQRAILAVTEDDLHARDTPRARLLRSHAA